MSTKKESHLSFKEQRRKLLKLLGLGGAVVLSESAAGQIRINKNVFDNQNISADQREIFISIKLLRPEDLLSLELRFYNFSLSGKQLQKKGNPAYLVVIFQPQTISEQAWNETASGLETPTVPGRLMIGGDSRLVFEIPANINSLPLDINELLAWENFNLVVNDRAKQPSRQKED
jgi:hypothetical protein